MGHGQSPIPHVFTRIDMASGRVGGTKSLKSGKVGDTVLGIVQEPNGSYAQKVSAYVPTKPQTQTVKLAVQQMCTSMVQGMMRDLKPLAKVSFQSAVNKSKSLNAFSSWNLHKVLNEAKNNWDEWHEFMFPEKGKWIKYGGTWILSSGTLHYNCWDGWYSDTGDSKAFDPLVRSTFNVIGVFFEYPKEKMTIGEFMELHKLQYNTEMWLAMFWLSDWVDPWPKPDDPYRLGKYAWKRITLNPKVRKSEIVTEDTLNQLFVTEASDADFNTWSRPNEYQPRRKHARCLGFQFQEPKVFYHQMYYGGFTINYVNGRKMISSSVMDFVHRDHYIEISTELVAGNAVYYWCNPRVPAPVPYPW